MISTQRAFVNNQPSKLLIQQVKIVDSHSPFHLQVVDIYIENGIIKNIQTHIKDIPTNEKNDIVVWNYQNQTDTYASLGWVDVGTYANDPGEEHKEDVYSAANAAAFGGFTQVLSAANTQPAIDNKSTFQYLKHKTAGLPVSFHPLGAVTKNCEGKEIAEMYEMHAQGAAAFSDGYHSIQHSGVLLRALLYVKAFGGRVCHQPLDAQIAADGYAHEGLEATMIGMRGIPALAESMMAQRDLYLLEYTASKLHLLNVSTAETVELIRAAKAKGLDVTASVNPMNLYFTDKALQDFDTNYKVSPPVRSLEHQNALQEGLLDGTIDFINTNHRPQDTEGKRLEFIYAEDGAIMLETAFALVNQAYGDRGTTEQLVEKMTMQQRKIFGFEGNQRKISIGEQADLTIFNRNIEWTYQADQIRSKSNNSPLKDQRLKGKVLGIVNNGQAQQFN